jgi:hypothetical protein
MLILEIFINAISAPVLHYLFLFCSFFLPLTLSYILSFDNLRDLISADVIVQHSTRGMVLLQHVNVSVQGSGSEKLCADNARFAGTDL